jgi:pentatricopeptide repeat protein
MDTLEGTIEAVSYELGLLVTFLASWLLSKVVSSFLDKKRVKVLPGSPPQKTVDISKTLSGSSPSTADVDATCSRILMLCTREYTKALRLYRDLCKAGHDAKISSCEFYLQLIQASVRVGNADVATGMFQAMRTHGVQRSLEFDQSVLRLLASKQHWNLVLSFAETFAHAIPEDRVVLSCISTAATVLGYPDIAIEMLRRCMECAPETVLKKDYINVFRAFAKSGDGQRAAKLFNLILSRKEVPPADVLALNIVLAAMVASRMQQESLDLLETMHSHEKGPLPDTVSYNTCLKVFATSRDVKAALNLIEKMQGHGVAADEITFGTVLHMCSNDEQVAKVQAAMVKAGMEVAKSPVAVKDAKEARKDGRRPPRAVA